jgi:tetratricopeptide (TPR) repeat protein
MKLRIAGSLSLLALLGTVSSSPLHAQEIPAAPVVTDDGVVVRLQGGRPGGENAVDEALLRYLASRGDQTAVAAEIDRLKRLHPDWQPPADLFGGPPAVDESPLWKLYEAGDYDRVRKRINAIRAERADWSPPAKLLNLMDVNEARARSEAAAGRGDWKEVVAILQAKRGTSTCDDIDNFWRLAEGLKRTGDDAGAMAAYTRIVTTCANPDHRFATLQKAKLLVTPDEMQRLVGLEKARSDAPERLAELGELTAKPVTKATAGAKPAKPAGPDFSRIYRPGSTVADARAVAQQVINRRDGAAARKIGWIYQTEGDTEAALPWFRHGLEWAPGAESAKGLAMALAALGNTSELEELGVKYPAIVTEAMGGQVAVAMERDDLPAVLRLTRQSRKPADLLLRSWSLMRLLRPTEAQAAFVTVINAPEAQPGQRDEAVYGLIRAQIAQHLFREAANSMARYGLPPDRFNEVQADLLAQQIQVAFQREDYRRAVALCEERRDYAQPDRGLEIQEAWARYHMGDMRAAERIFARLDRIVSTDDTEEGLDAVRRRSMVIGN